MKNTKNLGNARFKNFGIAQFKQGIAPTIIALIVALLAGGGYAVVKTNPGIAKKLGIEKQVEKKETIITILSPNGGEKLIIGQTYPVTWSLLNKDNLVRIVLVPGDIPVTSFANAAANFFSPFSWTIPSQIVPGSYKIEARLYSDSGSVPRKIASDVSDSYFTITAPTTADETADWKTYKNEKYGFEFKYPPGWKTEENLKVTVRISNLAKPGKPESDDLGVHMDINYYANPKGLTVEQWYEINVFKTEKQIVGRTVVDAMPALKTMQSGMDEVLVIYAGKDNSIFGISMIKSVNMDIFEKVLSSFKTGGVAR